MVLRPACMGVAPRVFGVERQALYRPPSRISCAMPTVAEHGGESNYDRVPARWKTHWRHSQPALVDMNMLNPHELRSAVP
jgi:hypothetical protein